MSLTDSVIKNQLNFRDYHKIFEFIHLSSYVTDCVCVLFSSVLIKLRTHGIRVWVEEEICNQHIEEKMANGWMSFSTQIVE